VLVLVAFALAVFVLPSPWGLVLVVGALLAEVGEAWLWLRWSRRRRPTTGIEAMVGRRATAATPCRPRGQVRVLGELWTAVCESGADAGDEVEIVGVDADGLTLRVAPAGR
jgi:membrane protein implicated in regulation of membrane protease activity